MRLNSTRGAAESCAFLEAATGRAPRDGGLWLPAALPRFADVDALLALAFPERAEAILNRLLGDELAPAEVAGLVARAFTFPLRTVAIDGRVSAVELFHGPTRAFKDFGARFLAALLELIAAREGGGPARTVLAATSGDTGAAVADALRDRAGVRAAILYPRGRISPEQERQIAAPAGNLLALAVDGSFDDCQRLVRGALAEPGADARLIPANSINVARLLAQCLYYFEAVAALPTDARARAVIAVPSGNFGNLCAGMLARELGLPVRAFVAATNANDAVPEHLEGGQYRPRPAVATLSSAMDVGAPSNWERILALHGGELSRVRAGLRWARASDGDTGSAMRALLRGGYLCDPHGAVAWHGLIRRLRPGERGLFLATAHPSKLRGTVRALTGADPGPPPLPAGKPCATPLSPRPEALAEVLRAFAAG